MQHDIPRPESAYLLETHAAFGKADADRLETALGRYHGQGSRVEFICREMPQNHQIRIHGDGPMRDVAADFAAGWLACGR